MFESSLATLSKVALCSPPPLVFQIKNILNSDNSVKEAQKWKRLRVVNKIANGSIELKKKICVCLGWGWGGRQKYWGESLWLYFEKYVVYLKMPVIHKTLPDNFQLNFVQGVRQ